MLSIADQQSISVQWAMGRELIQGKVSMQLYPEASFRTLMFEYLDKYGCLKHSKMSGNCKPLYTFEIIQIKNENCWSEQIPFRMEMSARNRFYFLMVIFGHESENDQNNKIPPATGGFQSNLVRPLFLHSSISLPPVCTSSSHHYH